MSTQPKSDPELVEVFDTKQESEAMVVQGLLTSAGIESVLANLEAPQEFDRAILGFLREALPRTTAQASHA